MIFSIRIIPVLNSCYQNKYAQLKINIMEAVNDVVVTPTKKSNRDSVDWNNLEFGR